MIEFPLGRLDIYALALPRGHGFGDQILRCPHDGDLGLIVMRRRTDGVWATTFDLLGLA